MIYRCVSTECVVRNETDDDRFSFSYFFQSSDSQAFKIAFTDVIIDISLSLSLYLVLGVSTFHSGVH